MRLVAPVGRCCLGALRCVNREKHASFLLSCFALLFIFVHLPQHEDTGCNYARDLVCVRFLPIQRSAFGSFDGRSIAARWRTGQLLPQAERERVPARFVEVAVLQVCRPHLNQNLREGLCGGVRHNIDFSLPYTYFFYCFGFRISADLLCMICMLHDSNCAHFIFFMYVVRQQ